MASILEVLSQSGAVPMEELKIRSPGSSEDVESRVVELKSQGIVEISSDPDLRTSEALGDDRLVRLTTKGLRSALAR